jgi:hypothetical protein
MREDGENQLKMSAPLPLRETYRLIPLSAKSISLDSPFKYHTVLLTEYPEPRNKKTFASLTDSV